MWNKVKAWGIGVGASLLGMIGSAHAALPTGVDTGFTAFGTDATTLAGYAGTAVMVVLGFTIGLKLTKRFANKI